MHKSLPVVGLADLHHDNASKCARSKCIEDCIAGWIQRAGGYAETQPEDLWLDDGRHPDIDVKLGRDRYLLDVSIVHPTAPTYVSLARNPMGGSANMVKLKHEKHLALARKVGATVIPVVLETFGALADPAVDFFKVVASYGHDRGSSLYSWREIYLGIVAELSHRLQEWNADVIRHAASKSSDVHVLR